MDANKKEVKSFFDLDISEKLDYNYKFGEQSSSVNIPLIISFWAVTAMILFSSAYLAENIDADIGKIISSISGLLLVTWALIILE